MSQQYTQNNNFSSFHGWIASYNDGSQSRIMSTGGVVNTSLPDYSVSMGTPYLGCDCEKVGHATYKSANVFQSPAMWGKNKCYNPLCGPYQPRSCY